MSSYSYIAIDPKGVEARGTLQVADPLEAVRRIKEMGLFPTRVLEERPRAQRAASPGVRRRWIAPSLASVGIFCTPTRVKPVQLIHTFFFLFGIWII